MTEKEIASVCKALGDENRIKIIQLLKDGELCACHILEAFNVTQPTLSHHMKILSDSGLVLGRKDGKWMHYSINPKTFEEVKSYIDIFCGKKVNKMQGVKAPAKCCCKNKTAAKEKQTFEKPHHSKESR